MNIFQYEGVAFSSISVVYSSFLCQKIDLFFYNDYISIIPSKMTTIQFFRIDNLIVERLPGGIAVGPIRLYEKKHQVTLDLAQVPYLSIGSRRTDSLFIQSLMDSEDPNLFDNLPITVPQVM
jgi:hypothetical protein